MKRLMTWLDRVGEKNLMLMMVVFATACTAYMILFVNEHPIFDALMILLNALLLHIYFEEEEE